MEDASEPVTVYSDYVCPFCYLGRVSFEQYERTRDGSVDIDWHPFDLRGQKRRPDDEIDHSIDDGKDDAYFDRVRENVDHLKEQYGADSMLGIDEVPEVDSFNAQLAAFYVDREHPGQWREFDDAIFEALWVDGRNIGDPEVLADIAESVELDGEDVRTAITDRDLRDQLHDRFQAARDRGVMGVPTFRYGEYVARGAVPPEHLKRLVDGH